MTQHTLDIQTRGRGFHRIDAAINDGLRLAGPQSGICHLFIQHTSASLIITENADPDVHRDLEVWMSSAVIDGDPRFAHDAEGPDDMSAHIRSALTQTSVTVPV
ncbi:MAG: secondary thiamine-phosphate synthase enzyme YjbQ, partial [Pseudomonadota bacterium]